MPEALFQDILEVNFDAGQSTVTVEIDPRFIGACEKGTIVCLCTEPDRLVLVNGIVCDGCLEVSRDRNDVEPLTVTALIIGVREGRSGKRFPEFTKKQFERNQAFWSQATKE